MPMFSVQCSLSLRDWARRYLFLPRNNVTIYYLAVKQNYDRLSLSLLNRAQSLGPVWVIHMITQFLFMWKWKWNLQFTKRLLLWASFTCSHLYPIKGTHMHMGLTGNWKLELECACGEHGPKHWISFVFHIYFIDLIDAESSNAWFEHMLYN